MRTITLNIPEKSDFEGAVDSDSKKALWTAVNNPWKNDSGYVDISLVHKVLKQAVTQIAGSVISPLNENRAHKNEDFSTAWNALRSDIIDIQEAVENMSRFEGGKYTGSLTDFFAALSGKFKNGVREAGLDTPTAGSFAEQTRVVQQMEGLANLVQRLLEEKEATKADQKAEDLESRLNRIEELLSNAALRTGRKTKSQPAA